MAELTVSFLYFDGCPLAPRARTSLAGAIRQFKPDIRVGLIEVDLMDAQTPDDMKRWGSPTILINGQDIAGGPQGSGHSCRIYPGEERVPSAAEIADAICAGLET